jgi:UDP-N-acetylglucosamine 2-epimerase (non-hydrolysing)
LAHLLANLQARVADVLQAGRFDGVVVQGDTLSALSGALAARLLRLPLFHVEAGLRSGDDTQPWPEELTRRTIGALAQVHFAPTRTAAEALWREGVRGDRVVVVGNTIVDAVRLVLPRVPHGALANSAAVREWLSAPQPRRVLITCHRRENQGGGISRILTGVGSALSEYSDARALLPIHLSPAVVSEVQGVLKTLPDQIARRVGVVEPQPYLSFLGLLLASGLVVTDSGGVQEEAASVGRFIIVAREATERPEAVSPGVGVLVGTASPAIRREVLHRLSLGTAPREEPAAAAPFGDGFAAERILALVLNELAPKD